MVNATKQQCGKEGLSWGNDEGILPALKKEHVAKQELASYVAMKRGSKNNQRRETEYGTG
jgi:hypothetical protein